MGKGGGAHGASSGAMSSAAQMFMGSNSARRMMFKSISSALQTGGGKGMRGGLVHMGIARSREAGQAALMNAGSGLGSLDANLRGRVLNRISREGMAGTAAIGPGLAQKFIASAPGAFLGASNTQISGLGVEAQGQAAALNAAASRAAGWSSATQSVASATGKAAGNWIQSYFAAKK